MQACMHAFSMFCMRVSLGLDSSTNENLSATFYVGRACKIRKISDVSKNFVFGLRPVVLKKLDNYSRAFQYKYKRCLKNTPKFSVFAALKAT